MQIVVQVPTGAKTGPIEVSAVGASASATDVFTVAVNKDTDNDGLI